MRKYEFGKDFEGTYWNMIWRAEMACQGLDWILIPEMSRWVTSRWVTVYYAHVYLDYFLCYY